MKWRLIRSFNGRPLAQQAADLLEQNGIKASIRGEDLSIHAGGGIASIPGVELYVPEGDEAKALELLNAYGIGAD